MRATTNDRLLVLDDSDEVAELIGELAESVGFSVAVTTDIDAFFADLEKWEPSVIVLDLQMPGTDGIEVLRNLAAIGSNASIFLVTGMDRQTALSAKRYGEQLGLNILGVQQKPFRPESLIATLLTGRSLRGRLLPEDLEAAIQDGTLVLRYQPVVRRLAADTWHAESVEALPRWNHPEFGVLTPGQFVPLITSDRSALMRELADFVLMHGTLQLKRWQEDGLHLGLRVNIPAGLITDTDFPDRLQCLLNEQNVDPSLLTLELSDAQLLARSIDGVEILTRLRLKSINLSIDDFGNSEAALIPLYALPISEVKIDQNVTADLVREPRADVVFGGVLRMLRDLSIACCAEGVETREQLDALDALGCDLSQGFYIGTPVPPVDLPRSLRAWTAAPYCQASGTD